MEPSTKATPKIQSSTKTSQCTSGDLPSPKPISTGSTPSTILKELTKLSSLENLLVELLPICGATISRPMCKVIAKFTPFLTQESTSMLLRSWETRPSKINWRISSKFLMDRKPPPMRVATMPTEVQSGNVSSWKISTPTSKENS